MATRLDDTLRRLRRAAQAHSMFHSARLKLTAFYLAVLLCFSVTLTFGVRMLAQHEFERANQAQRREYRVLARDFFGQPTVFVGSPPDDAFAGEQNRQSSLVDAHLNHYLLLINLGALLLGGALSYWFAGRTLEPIARAHEAQRRFASDASHELRTPLANMQVENEVFLRQKSFSEAEAREQLTSNLEEVQRLESLANNLLALTQYEQTSLHLAPVPLAKVVDDALKHAEVSFAKRQVRVDKTVAQAQVLGYRESLEQLIGIILDNAMKYGPEAGTIHIAGKQSGTQYALSVRDEGPGIAAADLPHIFERLYRGDKARSGSTGGYGLGLALAKSIAEANYATITAGNAEEGGALFTIELPLAKK